MTEFFSSPGEYLEKTAGMTFAGNAEKALEPTITLGGKLLSLPLRFIENNPKASLALGAGALGLGALGLWNAAGGERPGETYSYRINRGLNSLLDRIRYDESFATKFTEGVGGQSAEALVELTKDMVGKGYDTLKDKLMLSPARNTIFQALKREDPILADTDNKTLLEAFHTMANIAPNLSADKNAVKSVLRMAATSGGGLDYNTIRGLADAETAVNKAKGLT